MNGLMRGSISRRQSDYTDWHEAKGGEGLACLFFSACHAVLAVKALRCSRQGPFLYSPGGLRPASDGCASA